MGMTRKSYAAGEVIFHQGEPGVNCYQVVTGRVEIRLRRRGIALAQEEVVATMGPGEVFGEMAIVDEAPRSASAVAAEETVCAQVPADEVLDMIASNPDEAIFFIRTLIKRLRKANKKLASMG